MEVVGTVGFEAVIDKGTAEGLAGMVEAGYGNDLSDAARRAFILWCQANMGSVRRGDRAASRSRW